MVKESGIYVGREIYHKGRISIGGPVVIVCQLMGDVVNRRVDIQRRSVHSNIEQIGAAKVAK